MAIGIEAAVFEGAEMVRLRPASVTALAVVGPNAAIEMELCVKSGKFL